jgi:hypothetical protein
MTLSMVYLRLTLLSAFAIIVLVCISYAHSNNYDNDAIVTLKARSGCLSKSANNECRERFGAAHELSP